jgi:hypothetical protein
MSVRTAARNFDLQLAIATLPISYPALWKIDQKPDDSGSVWLQQFGRFSGKSVRITLA